LRAGEKVEVKLEMYVDKKTAHCLNSGKDKLYDILVLHLLGGKDIFITVCTNLKTAFSKYRYIQVNDICVFFHFILKKQNYFQFGFGRRLNIENNDTYQHRRNSEMRIESWSMGEFLLLAWSRIIRPPETLALYKSFNPLLTVS
jgi:hypothetical protein